MLIPDFAQITLIRPQIQLPCFSPRCSVISAGWDQNVSVLPVSMVHGIHVVGKGSWKKTRSWKV